MSTIWLTVNTFNIYSVQYVGSRRKLTFRLIGVTFIEGGLYSKLRIINYLNATPSLISQNLKERNLFLIEISLLVVTIPSPYIVWVSTL